MSVGPPSLPEVGQEGGSTRASQSELGQQSPDKTVVELASPKDLSNRPRRHTTLRVGHGVWRSALPAAVGVGVVGRSGGGRRHQGRQGQCLGQAGFHMPFYKNLSLEEKHHFIALISTGPHVFPFSYFCGETVQSSPVFVPP